MTGEVPFQGGAKFRDERFIESDPDRISLIKIGEYMRTPLYEPSIRAMCITLSEVRKQLQADRSFNKQFNEAWKAATKIFKTRQPFFQSKFKGPDEYCIALICFTLDEPFSVYQEFSKLCQDLLTNAWGEFPFKSLFYLIIQSEMRLRVTEEEETAKKFKTIRQPITITTDLDYSIEEEKEEDDDDDIISESINSEVENGSLPSPRKLHSTSPIIQMKVHRVFLGFAFRLSETEFRPRNLVAFNYILPTTLDGLKLTKLLEEKGKPVTLVEIDQVSWSSRYIASLSLFPVEKEVVIWPWIKFYVEERKMITQNVEKIVLKPTSRSFVGTAAEIGSGPL